MIMYVSDPSSIARIPYSKELRYFETNEAIVLSRAERILRPQFKPFSQTNQRSTCLVML